MSGIKPKSTFLPSIRYFFVKHEVLMGYLPLPETVGYYISIRVGKKYARVAKRYGKVSLEGGF